MELPDLVLSGLIHVSELDDDFYTFDATRLRFVGKRNRRVFAIGDRLRVEVANVDTFKRQVDFRPAKDEDEPEDEWQGGGRMARRKRGRRER